MKVIPVILILILISTISVVEAYKFNKPIIYVDRVLPSRMSDQYIVFISICTPKIMKYPTFEVYSDVDSWDLQYKKIIGKNKCASMNLTLMAEDPDSIKARLT